MNRNALAVLCAMLVLLISAATPLVELDEQNIQLLGGEGGDDPVVRITYPSGGEVFNVGDVIFILYNNDDLSGDIILEFTTDGNSFYGIATKPISPSSSFQHEWTVLNVPTTTAQIRITSTSDSTITDISDHFTILGESEPEVERDYECEDFDGFAGPVWASGTVYYIGNIVEHPAGSGEFWIVETVETLNLPLDGDWEGPCSCRDIWNGTKDTWGATSAYSHYKIVYHDGTYYYANDETPAGKTPGGPDWWIACGDAHACDNLQGQVSQFWSPSIAGPSPQIGPGYSKGDVVTIQTTSGLVPNVWVSNVDQNHAIPMSELETIWETGWDITVVDNDPWVGYWTGIGLDSQDNVHISYFDDLNNHQKYATYDGTSWSLSVIDTPMGSHSALVVDSNDHIHVTYGDELNQLVKYAYHDGNSWTLSVVGPVSTYTGGGGTDTTWAIDVDANNNPHIAYFNLVGSGAEMMYTTFDGNAWTTTSIDPNLAQNGAFSDIAVDSQGNVHISYLATKPGCVNLACEVRYAFFDGMAWATQAVGMLGDQTSIAVDSDDNPRIAYARHGSTNRGISEARWDGTVWNTEVVTQDKYGGGNVPSIVIDDDDYSHIASRGSFGSVSQYLAYSTDMSGVWETDVVDTYAGWASYTDIALDSYGYPHISYFENDDFRNLRYATLSHEQGVNWTKCNCSDLAEPWVADNGENIYYDALSVVSHNGNYWMSIADNNRLEPGTYPSDWVLCVDGNPCENKTAGEDYSYGIVYGMGDVVEHPMNSGNYWVSLQTENAVVPSDTATQWWWPCSCEDLVLSSWQTGVGYQQWQVVEWEGIYWIALVDHSSTAADSPDIPGGATYWEPCEAEFCTSTGWWGAGMAVSGLYDTGVVVTHPYPHDYRWVSQIDDNQWLPIVNSEYWLRCNSDDPIIDGGGGEPADPPVDGDTGDSDGGGSTSPLPGFSALLAVIAVLLPALMHRRFAK